MSGLIIWNFHSVIVYIKNTTSTFRSWIQKNANQMNLGSMLYRVASFHSMVRYLSYISEFTIIFLFNLKNMFGTEMPLWALSNAIISIGVCGQKSIAFLPICVPQHDRVGRACARAIACVRACVRECGLVCAACLYPKRWPPACMPLCA